MRWYKVPANNPSAGLPKVAFKPKRGKRTFQKKDELKRQASNMRLADDRYLTKLINLKVGIVGLL